MQMGASKAELKERGVTNLLESRGTKPVFPAEVMKHLDENPYQLKEITKSTSVANMDPNKSYSVPKFSQWQTPGGENYREILMTAPDASQKLTAVQHPSGKGYALLKSDGSYVVAGPDTIRPGTPLMWDTATAADKYGIPFHRAGFTGGHWDEPNVLAHMRVNDRVLPSGEKALHVEEWQSDWAGALRKEKGYSPPSGNHAPPHPLVDNWQDLMARRTLKEAADGGYDRVTWTTGAQQADRYDLSKQVDDLKLEYYDSIKGTVNLTGYKGNKDVFAEREIPMADLHKHIGKGPAEKLETKLLEMAENGVEWPVARISGLDLKIGGEWATKLYDESMVNRFNKIGKKYGVQVEDIDIAQGTKHPETYTHSLKITPEMRKSIGATKFHPFADLPGPLTNKDVSILERK